VLLLNFNFLWQNRNLIKCPVSEVLLSVPKNNGRYTMERPRSVLIQVERVSKKNNYTIIVV